MPHFLAIDAGGTNTSCILADSAGARLAHATSGSIKLLRVPPDEAEHNLRQLLHDVAERSALSLTRVHRTCIGIAGISTPSVRDWTLTTLRRLVPGDILLCGDEEIALDGAFAGGPGVLVLAGTGSNVVARGHSGQIFHVGGWGPALGDEGSAMWIGLEALRASFRDLDRNPNGHLRAEVRGLLQQVCSFWRLPGLQALVERANQLPPPNFAELSPLVVAAADAGDEIARKVLRRAGDDLAHLALLAHERVAAAALPHSASDQTGTPESPAFAYAGSILTRIDAVRLRMIYTLQSALPGAVILDRPADPLEGALWRARNG